MHPDLNAFVGRCADVRNEHPPVSRVFQDSLQRLGWSADTLDAWRTMPAEAVAKAGAQARLFRTALAVAERVENDTQAAYHNRDHTAEAVLAAETLMANEPLSAAARMNQGLRLLAAMVAHDVGHTGAFGTPKGSLEEASAHVFEQEWKALGPVLDRTNENDVVRSIILGTEFSEGPRNNAARFAQSPASLLPRLHVLANDADVLASVLPETGPERGRLLAREWQEAGPAAAGPAAAVGSWAGRLGFLKVVTMASDSARALGVGALRQAEIEAIEAITPQVLAAMPAAQAEALVRERLMPQERRRLTV